MWRTWAKLPALLALAPENRGPVRLLLWHVFLHGKGEVKVLLLFVRPTCLVLSHRPALVNLNAQVFDEVHKTVGHRDIAQRSCLLHLAMAHGILVDGQAANLTCEHGLLMRHLGTLQALLECSAV